MSRQELVREESHVFREAETWSCQELPSLSLAINCLFEQQEKDWGCFQVKKEADKLYHLYIPHFPGLKFYQNPDKQIYKAFWGNSKEPAITVKKKQRKVYDPQKPRTELKQRVYDVVYQYDSRTEIQRVNQIMAQCIRDRLESSLSSLPQSEITPSVVITKEIG